MNFHESKLFSSFCSSFAESTVSQPNFRDTHYETAKSELEELNILFPKLLDIEQCLRVLTEHLDQAQDEAE